MDILAITISGLAVWRISNIVSFEDGPFDIFKRFRYQMSYLGLAKDKKLFKTFYDGLTCLWCNSVWFSFLVSLFICSNMLELVIYTFSISAVAILLDSVISYLNTRTK